MTGLRLLATRTQLCQARSYPRNGARGAVRCGRPAKGERDGFAVCDTHLRREYVTRFGLYPDDDGSAA
jgi:hypothetical protein